MVHYYIYIECGSTLTDTARFYKVGIGQSEMGRRQMAFLESYALEHGHFFVIVSLDAWSFVEKCLGSIGKSLADVLPCTAEHLIKHFKVGEELPETYFANLQRHKLMMAIDPAYYTQVQLQKR